MTKSKIELRIANNLIPDNKISLVCMLLLLILISSCARPVKLPDLSSINVSEYIADLEQDQNIIKSVKGLALVRLRSPQHKVSYRQATIVQSPNLLRLEAFSVFGRTEAVIISDGKTVGLKYSNSGWEYHGINEFDISLFYNLIPVNINIEQLSTFLLGKVPEHIFKRNYSLGVDDDEGLLVFNSLEGDNELFVNHNFRKIVKADVDLHNGEKVQIKFNNFKRIYPNGYFPTKLELEFMNLSIYVKYDDDIKINKEIDQQNYSLNRR